MLLPAGARQLQQSSSALAVSVSSGTPSTASAASGPGETKSVIVVNGKTVINSSTGRSPVRELPPAIAEMLI